MAEKPKVFVIDDDPLVRKSLSLLLEAEAIDTAAYASAEDFLGDYQPEQPGCLLLDYALPNMDGLELQQALIAKNAYIPIIFLSGRADVPVSVQALKAGAVDFYFGSPVMYLVAACFSFGAIFLSVEASLGAVFFIAGVVALVIFALLVAHEVRSYGSSQQ